MQAVELSNNGLVFFCPVEFPESLRRGIIEGGVGEIRDDVRVVHPGGPKDVYRPSYVLCVSLSDPGHYEFIDRGQVDPTRLRVVDTAFRVIDTVERWWKFLKLRAEMQEMMSVTGVEASGSLEDPD